jgi:hypothetical protein
MHCCQRCASVVVWASLHPPVGIIALVSPASPLVSRTGVYPVLTPSQPGIFTRILLASLLVSRLCSCPHCAGPALHCHCCRRYAGVIALVARASPPCCTGIFSLAAPRIAASISNWCLPSPAAVAACWRMWRCCRLLAIANGFVAVPGITPLRLGL